MRTAIGFVVGMTGWVLLGIQVREDWKWITVLGGMLLYLSGMLHAPRRVCPDD